MASVCRLCGTILLSAEGTKDLLDEMYASLKQQVDRYLHIQVLPNDRLPHTICSECDNMMNQMVQFIRNAQEVQRTLLARLSRALAREAASSAATDSVSDSDGISSTVPESSASKTPDNIKVVTLDDESSDSTIEEASEEESAEPRQENTP